MVSFFSFTRMQTMSLKFVRQGTVNMNRETSRRLSMSSPFPMKKRKLIEVIEKKCSCRKRYIQN